MNPENVILVDKISELFPFIIAVVAISVGGWVFTTWLRIKNGYPLETSWGRAIHPHTDKEAIERIKLLTNENAQLRAELGSVRPAGDDRADPSHRPASRLARRSGAGDR
jgi:hypothetical protein